MLVMCRLSIFFFTDPAAPKIYTLSLHDALPISLGRSTVGRGGTTTGCASGSGVHAGAGSTAGDGVVRAWNALAIAATTDRKSTRLNSSHMSISYAVFCLKKKNKP